jgi:hypothetical protein
MESIWSLIWPAMTVDMESEEFGLGALLFSSHFLMFLLISPAVA